MKSLSLALAFFLLTSTLFGQTEFITYNNGLIYNESTMYRLGHIVDSLNLKYKVCDFNKVFYSKSQTVAHIIRLDTNDIKQAKTDMQSKISFEDFILKYPFATIEKNVLVVKSKYKDYKEKEIVEFSEINMNSDYAFEITHDNIDNLYNAKLKHSWLFDYNKKTEYYAESITAFYFPEEFKASPLGLKYSKQIGYTDCLIDTTAAKFKENAKNGWVSLPKGWRKLSDKKKAKLLNDMRSTQVIGNCSQDSRPREHAVNIALLSAETTNWEVFLKSHLDIMNDNFERMSDGSYAYAQRKTYIKELEKLNLNVVDLLIGISLRIENPASNHYYGSIIRLGRAISESENKEGFKKQILSMIEDHSLDNLNRVLAFYLFLNFNNYIEDTAEQNNNTVLLKNSINSLPDFLKEKINFEKEQ